MPDGEHSHPGHEAAIDALATRIDTDLAALAARVDALEHPEPPRAPFPVAWWAMSSESAIAAHVAAGFTHNIIWNPALTVGYLDLLHAHGVKAIVALKPEHVGHPAVVGAIVAEEADIVVAGKPERTPAEVGQAATAARALWPGIRLYATLSGPLTAGPLSPTEPESVEAGYWSLTAGLFGNVAGDTRYGDHPDGYAGHVDVVAAQTFTTAGDPLTPKFRKHGTTAPDKTPTQLGVRRPEFVEPGLRRARRLCGPRVEIWALLDSCKMRTEWGRNPTATEIGIEIDGMFDAGATGLLWFDKAGGAGIPTEALLADPPQLAVIAAANDAIQARSDDA